MLSTNLRFLAYKIFFEPRWRLNKNKKTRLGTGFDWIFSGNKQQRTAFSISAPASRSSRAPAPPGLPPPILVRFANLWNEEINYHKFSDTHSEAQRLVCT